MKKIIIFIIIAAVVAVLVWLKYGKAPERNSVVYKDLIEIYSPLPEGEISSPLKITGRARGNWFFEASFPVVLTDWDGRIIAEWHAQAQGEWMTEDFVPFEAVLEFESPYSPGDQDFMKRGALILRKDNPSGLSEFDDALEITVFFK